ncbi:hypothetical protein CerSpe_112420 [Prunus speciosa]
MLEGCKFAKQQGCAHIVIESDCREIINALQQSISRGRWHVYPMLTLIKEIQAEFTECSWSWVPITANLAGDHLARIAMSRMSPSFWVNRPPSSLIGILNKDGLPCPPQY